jgi:tetratricopeptide (TPR) repeat protein
LALARHDLGDIEGALSMFHELLALNPDDNQGVRSIAVNALIKLERFKEALDIANLFPDDTLVEVLYGKALALFKLGQRDKATMALQEAICDSPLVARELVKTKHRPPKTAIPGMITRGGTDEAYYYWEHMRQSWEDKEVFEWLKGTEKLVDSSE